MSENPLFTVKIFLFLVAIIFGVLAVGGYIYYNSTVYSPNKGDGSVVRFVISSGENIDAIAENLFEQGIIKSDFMFKVYVRLKKIDTRFEAGAYNLPNNLSIAEVAEALQQGYFDARITFPEGLRIEEIVLLAGDTIAVGDSDTYINEFLNDENTIEGYMFPDTYSYNDSTTPSVLAQTMRNRFEEVMRPLIDDYEGPLTEYELVTLASIVEREGRSIHDRSIIAGILLKRLREGMPLQADATTQYQMANREMSERGLRNTEFWPNNIYQPDLEEDSPYNTRINAGLPPTPICNPGKESMLSVLEPVDTPYWYYMHDRQGNAHFAETLDGHNANVFKYLHN